MLTISEVSICNSALVKLGQDVITSLDQDTKSARLCNARYAMLRNMVLEAHPWRFATKTVELASIAGTPIMDWTYQFNLPADCIIVQRGEDWEQEFEVLDGILMADEAPIKIKYTFENTDPSTYSYTFAECLAWRIAADLAYAITNSNTVATSMMTAYLAEIANARYVSAKGSTPQDLQVNTFLNRRN